MSSVLLCLVFFPMLCGPVSYLIGRRSKKMRDRFIVLATLLELLATVAVVAGEHVSLRLDGFCGLGIGFEYEDIHSVSKTCGRSGLASAHCGSRCVCSLNVSYTLGKFSCYIG